MSDVFSSTWIAAQLADLLRSAAGAPERAFVYVTSDSRKAQPGSLFVALKGERVDGHDYILPALKSGASAVISARPFTEEERSYSSSAILWEVKDSLAAYRQLGQSWRRRFEIPVLMIAGSNGKTTTKEVLFALLQGKWDSVHKTQGSENGFVGIPMTLLELRDHHSAAVIEVGIDEPGAMKHHHAVVSPTHAVVTAVGPEHLEKLGTLEVAAQEECLALELTASTGGMSFVLMEDPFLSECGSRLAPSHRKTLSLTDFSAAYAFDESSSSFFVDGTKTLAVPPELLRKLPGRHNLSNLLCALSIAHHVGLAPKEMLHGLARFSGAYGRSQIETRPNGTLVYCDYYNAQPLSVKAGLESFSKLATQRIKWVCLADMLELGQEEERYHREIAAHLCAIQAEQVLLYGQRMRWLKDELEKNPEFSGKIRHFSTHAEIAQAINRESSPGDAIFIKGSRGMKMEEVHKLLSS